MDATNIRVLIVSDDRQALDHLCELLRLTPPFDTRYCSTTQEALHALQHEPFDIVLVDHHLAGRESFQLVRAAIETGCDAPVLLLSPGDCEEVDERAIQVGALGFLDLQKLDAANLRRVIRFTAEGERLRSFRRREALLSALRRHVGIRPAPVTEELFHAGTLKQAAPPRFSQLAKQYATLLDRALEQQAYRVDCALSDRCRILADELGSLGAGPRDVIELHCAALQDRTQNANSHKAQAYVNQGSVLVLEVMGNLTSYYRHLCRGLYQTPARGHNRRCTPADGSPS